MNDERILEILNETVEEIGESDAIVLVEGRKDKESLRNIGIGNDMIMVQSEGGPMKASEAVFNAGRSAIILTDWDRKGEILANDLARNLGALDVEYDLRFRERLRTFTKKYVKDAESLDSLMARLEEEGRI